ncbi:MAG: hypothetical protein ACRDD3_02705 [Azovibrio sp.]
MPIKYSTFGPGDPITWGRPTDHPLDPRSTCKLSEEAEEYCPSSCPNLHGMECHRHSIDLEQDAIGVLCCTQCHANRLEGHFN